MKKSNLSAKKRLILFSLIPCAFSLLLLLFTWWRIPALLVFGWTLCMLWIGIGYQSRRLLPHYGKALLLVNWMALPCLVFALIFYQLMISHMLWYSELYFPISDDLIRQYFIPQYIAGDVIAALYPGSFLFGAFYPYLGHGNRILAVITINVVSGLLLFTLGYVAGAIKDRFFTK